jgi:hypothetical protein
MRLGVRHLTAILFSRSMPAVRHPDSARERWIKTQPVLSSD